MFPTKKNHKEKIDLVDFIPAPPTAKNTETIHARQIAFAAAFLLPAAKFLEAPSLLARYAKGDLLFPAVLHFLVQALVLLGVLYAASQSEKSLLERLQNALGKGIYVVYVLYAAYFLFAAVLPLLDMEKFVYAAFFDTAPTAFSFAAFFFFAAFACVKGVKSIGRSADLCLFLFLLPFCVLMIMSLTNADFSNLMPFFGTPLEGSMQAFSRTAPHFSDAVLLLPLIANLRYKKNDGVKITIGYASGAVFTLFFLAVFFSIYGSIAPREHYAFSKVAQYFPALSVVGRIDLVFIYLLSVVLLFYTCLPLQYTADLLAKSFSTKRKTFISAILSLALLFAVLFLNRFYDGFYATITGKLPFVFWLIADMLPLFLLFLPKNPNSNTPIKKEKRYA